jgi:aspartate racemase
MAKKVIGILAGMGPRSTAPFISTVIDECQQQYGAKEDMDFPPMMIYSLPTPFYLNRPLDNAAIKRTIAAGLRHLESTGVDFISMPCNTAHLFYQEISGLIDIPLLNMIDITLHMRPEGVKKMALLATRPTVAGGLYQNGASRLGVELVVKEEWQALVDGVLESNGQARLDVSRERWHDLVTQVKDAGLDAAVIACTDLNVVSGGESGGLTLLDSAGCLARATVQRWYSGS